MIYVNLGMYEFLHRLKVHIYGEEGLGASVEIFKGCAKLGNGLWEAYITSRGKQSFIRLHHPLLLPHEREDLMKGLALLLGSKYVESGHVNP